MRAAPNRCPGDQECKGLAKAVCGAGSTVALHKPRHGVRVLYRSIKQGLHEAKPWRGLSTRYIMEPHRPESPSVSNSVPRLLRQAELLLSAGNARAAQSTCEQILRKIPRNPEALFLISVAYLAQARVEDAITALQRVISSDPRHGAALENLGLAHLLQGKYAGAEEALRRAANIPGAPPSVYMRLGIALLEQGRAEEALLPLRDAVRRAPNDGDCQLNLGRALASSGDVVSAQQCFQAALRLLPDQPEPAYNLGVLSLQQGDLAQARSWLERSVVQSPAFVDARLNLAIVLQRQGELAQAETELRNAARLAPGQPAIAAELARTFLLQGRSEVAREHYLRVLEHASGYLEAHEGLAAACIALGRIREAIAHLRIIVAAQPDNVPAAAALAKSLFEVGDLAEAHEQAKRILVLDKHHAPSYAILANIHLVRAEIAQAIDVLETGYTSTRASVLLGMLAFQLRQTCNWEKWQSVWEEIVPLLDRGVDLSSPFWLLCEPTSAAQQLFYTRHWASTRFHGISPLPRSPHSGIAGRRLRIGYLSADFHEHATAYLVADVLAQHDSNAFEVFAYSYGPDDKSPMRERLRRTCEHFKDIAQQPDDLAARDIRDDALDILVDLKGYTVGDRLQIMARRPCDIQLTWLGYPGTTGASFIDYIISDPVVIPPGDEQYYSEKVLRVPHCYQPNDRRRAVAEPLSREAYGLPSGSFVFACFNQAYKITPDVFAVWMELLKSVPESVLWLLEGNSLAKESLLQSVERSGVDADRLVFGARLPNAMHLSRYRVADLALDTFPYTSHTTMSDALWCGCAAVALCGQTFASRVSASLLIAAGLPDLVAHSLPEYRELALEVARNPARLQQVRTRIEAARDHSPLFDANGLARDLEHLYLKLVQQHPGRKDM